MDARQAIEVAKGYITDLFSEDGVSALRLEEIEKGQGSWSITLGFMRPMALSETGVRSSGALSALSGLYGPRIYRVVTINDANGEVQSVRIRDGLD